MSPPPLDQDLYRHLRALAGRIHSERASAEEPFQPTELLHEAWEKVSRSQSTWRNRSHFIAVAARAMRQVLIDRSRSRLASRHGGLYERTTLSGVGDAPGVPIDVLALDEALRELERLDPRAGEVVLLRTFGGLTVAEVAEAIQVSPRTVDDTWRFARAWLANRLDTA